MQLWLYACITCRRLHQHIFFTFNFFTMNTTTRTARSSSVTKSSENHDQQLSLFANETVELQTQPIMYTSDEFYALADEADAAVISGSLLDMQRIFKKYVLYFEPTAEEKLGPLSKTTIFYNEAYLIRQMAKICKHYDDLAFGILLDKVTKKMLLN